MEICSSETSADLEWTAQRDIPKDRTLAKANFPAESGVGDHKCSEKSTAYLKIVNQR
jgi:hypothetical protein